jgi:predicted ABC-type exoprotein transport system permease subunit
MDEEVNFDLATKSNITQSSAISFVIIAKSYDWELCVSIAEKETEIFLRFLCLD